MLDEIPSNKTDHPQVTEHSLMYIEVSSSNLAQTIYIYKIIIFVRWDLGRYHGNMDDWKQAPNFEFTRFSKNPVIIFSYFLDETTWPNCNKQYLKILRKYNFHGNVDCIIKLLCSIILSS